MGVQGVSDLSLGEWAARAQGWAQAHGQSKAEAPTEDQFDLAVMQARATA